MQITHGSMIIFKTAKALQAHLLQQKRKTNPVGFVPTMGALHPGHLSLVAASKKDNAVTVCSIFVNPTQFNNHEDFTNYPSTIEKDIELLISVGCDVLFLPSVTEIYPPEHQKKIYPLGRMEELLEGHYRPGHFQGVCEVVDRLLELVDPQVLYLGQKDYQQCMVVAKMIQLTGRQDKVRLEIVPTMREENGLAMSSRNMRLSPEERIHALLISQQLLSIKEHFYKKPLLQLKEEAATNLQRQGFTVDYVEIAEGETLEPADTPQDGQVALIAATIGKVRLIDNMLLDGAVNSSTI